MPHGVFHQRLQNKRRDQRVVGVRIERVALADGRHLKPQVAPLAAALEQQQVAAVGVERQHAGFLRRDGHPVHAVHVQDALRVLARGVDRRGWSDCPARVDPIPDGLETSR